MSAIVYSSLGASSNAPANFASNAVGAPKITFTQGQASVAPSGTAFLCSAFSISDNGASTTIPDNVGEPMATIVRKGLRSGSASLIWPLGTAEKPVSLWEFAHTEYGGTGTSSKTFVVTSVSESRSAEGGLRAVDIQFHEKSPS